VVDLQRLILLLIHNIINDAGLEVADFSVNESNGGIAVNAFSTNMRFDVPGMKDEHFIGGISFTNNPSNGFQVSPYINRLVCANGLVTRGFEEQYKLTKLDDAEMNQFRVQSGPPGPECIYKGIGSTGRDRFTITSKVLRSIVWTTSRVSAQARNFVRP
jgi:hypothetical protein